MQDMVIEHLDSNTGGDGAEGGWRKGFQPALH